MHEEPAPSPAETAALAAKALRGEERRRISHAGHEFEQFVRETLEPHATKKGDNATNVIDQDRKRTYALPEPLLEQLYQRLEECRREQVDQHFSERQGSERVELTGIMLDFDLALPEEAALEWDRRLREARARAGACAGDRLTRGGPAAPAKPRGPAPPAEPQQPRANGAAAQGPRIGHDLEEVSLLPARLVQRLAIQVAFAVARDFDPAAGPEAELSLQFFYLERPGPGPPCPPRGGAEKGLRKYGFHLLAPGVRLSRPAKKHLIARLREDPTVARLLAEPGFKARQGDPDDLKDVIDPASASVPNLFFGSSKPGHAPYRLVGAIEVTCTPAEVRAGWGCPFTRWVCEGEAEGRCLVQELALAGPCPDPPPPPPPPGAAEPGRPREAGPLVRAQAWRPVPALAASIESEAARTANGAAPPEELLLTRHALEALTLADPEARLLHQLLDLLPAEMSRDYVPWRNVVFALANSAPETADYRPLAEWFSQKCPEKWAAGGREALEQLWAEARAGRGREGGLTKRSLHFWARQAEPRRYADVTSHSFQELLAGYVYEHRGQLEHAMVAEVLKAMLGTRFAVDVEGRTPGGRALYSWYEFVTPEQSMLPGQVWKWRQEPEPDSVYIFLTREFDRAVQGVLEHVKAQQAAARDEEAGRFYRELGRSLAASRRRLFQMGFQRGVVQSATFLFRERGFLDRLDRVPDLMGVGNGVLRLAAPGRPRAELVARFHEWPVARFTPAAYRPFDPREPWTRLLLGAFADIVPEPDARLWLLFYLATGLYRGLKEPFMLFWVGGGCNGKTFVLELMRRTLGEDYSTKCQIGMLTCPPPPPDKPNSAKMRLENRGYAFFEESSKSEMLLPANLKEYVNPGSVSGRGLNRDEKNFTLCSTLVAASNYNFIVDMTDHGTWRRIRFYRSKVRFCARPDPENEYEKQDDIRFAHEYVSEPACHAAFLSILVHFWGRLQREYRGRMRDVPCPTLVYETEVYRNSQDVLNRFITERVVVSPGRPEPYSVSVFSSEFNDWYIDNVGARQAGGAFAAGAMAELIVNSALEPYLRRAPNNTRVLANIRILKRHENFVLEPGEAFIGAGAGAGTEPPPRLAPPPGVDWWDWRPPAQKKPPRAAAHAAPPPAEDAAAPGRGEAGAEAQPPGGGQELERSSSWGLELEDDRLFLAEQRRRRQEPAAGLEPDPLDELLFRAPEEEHPLDLLYGAFPGRKKEGKPPAASDAPPGEDTGAPREENRPGRPEPNEAAHPLRESGLRGEEEATGSTEPDEEAAVVSQKHTDSYGEEETGAGPSEENDDDAEPEEGAEFETGGCRQS